jgi:hypothetical protein
MFEGRPQGGLFACVLEPMLQCGSKIAAMQTNRLSWHLVYLHCVSSGGDQAVRKTQRMRMPKTISIALPQSASLLGQLLALIDRALMASARAAVRNGDLPHFGL